jgi:hypothetical protein
MSVVNCKVSYIRPKYNNLEEWMKDPNNVYIGRGGVVFIEKVRFPKQASRWCNNYKVGVGNGKYTREEAIELYEKDLREMVKKPEVKAEFLKLKGKTLGCWCHPEGCHGDVILKLLQELEDH